MKGYKTNARVRREYDVVQVLNNLKLKIHGQPHDEEHVTTVPRFKHCKANEDRMTPKFDCYSGNTTEKMKASNTTKKSCRTNYSTKYSRGCTKNMESTPERQKLHTFRNNATQT